MADPDLQIRGRSHPDPEIRGGSLKKIFFRPFGPQFSLKIRWWGWGGGGTGPPSPSPGSTTAHIYHLSTHRDHSIFINTLTLYLPPSHPRLCQVKKIKEKKVYVFISSYISAGPYLGFFVCGGKLGFREISDQYSYKKQPSKIRHYVRKKTFSFPGGGNCPLRPPAMYGPVQVERDIPTWCQPMPVVHFGL